MPASLVSPQLYMTTTALVSGERRVSCSTEELNLACKERCVGKNHRKPLILRTPKEGQVCGNRGEGCHKRRTGTVGGDRRRTGVWEAGRGVQQEKGAKTRRSHSISALAKGMFRELVWSAIGAIRLYPPFFRATRAMHLRRRLAGIAQGIKAIFSFRNGALRAILWTPLLSMVKFWLPCYKCKR